MSLPDRLPPGFWDTPRRYICPVGECHRVYMRKSTLHGHLRKTHPERPDLVPMTRPLSTKVGKLYCCPFSDCPSGFARKHDLARHLAQKHVAD